MLSAIARALLSSELQETCRAADTLISLPCWCQERQGRLTQPVLLGAGLPDSLESMVIFSSSRHRRALFWCACAIRSILSDGAERQLNAGPWFWLLLGSCAVAELAQGQVTAGVCGRNLLRHGPRVPLAHRLSPASMGLKAACVPSHQETELLPGSVGVPGISPHELPPPHGQ